MTLPSKTRSLYGALAAATLFLSPSHLAAAPAPDSFVVADFAVRDLVRYDTSGNREPAYGSVYFVPPQNHAADGIAFGPDGNVYVAAPVGNVAAILRFDGVTGAALGLFVGPAQGFVRGFGGGLTFGPDGSLYVAAGFGIDRYCGPLSTTCVPGDPLPAPGHPQANFVNDGLPGATTDMVFGPDNHLYVTTGNGLVPTDAQHVKRFCGPFGSGGCTPGDPLPAGSQPPGSATYADAGTTILKGLAFDPDGDLYSVDASGGVLRFCGPVARPCAPGAPVPAPGQTGATYAPTPSGPRGLDFGPDGNIYVAMLGGQGIQRYLGPRCGVPGCDGQPFPAVGQTGATLVHVGGPENLSSPVFLKFPHPQPPPPQPDTVLLVATDAGNVLSFDPGTGSPLGEVIAPGTGGLGRPMAMAVDANGNVLVGSDGDVRKGVFRYDGSTLAPLGSPAEPPGSALFVSTVSGPVDVAFGPDANLYVNLVGVVQRFFGSDGTPAPAPGQPGSTFAPAIPAGGCLAGDAHCGHLDASGLEFDPRGNLLTIDGICVGLTSCSSPDESNDLVRFDQNGGFTDRGMTSPGLPHDSGSFSIDAFVIGPDDNYYVAGHNYFAGTQTSQGFVLRFKIDDVSSMTGTGLPAPGQPATGLPYFVAPGAGGLQDPVAMRFGPAPDDSLYVIDRLGGVLRYGALTGQPLPAWGQGGQSAMFIPRSSLGSATPTAFVFHPTFGQPPRIPVAIDGFVTDDGGFKLPLVQVSVGEFILGTQGSLLGSFLVSPLGLFAPAPVAMTDEEGHYVFDSSVVDLWPGNTYLFSAFPRAGSTLFPNSVIATVPAGTTHFSLPNIVFLPATPIPAGTTLTPSQPACAGPPNDNSCGAPVGVPVVSWSDVLTLTTQGCTGGSATYTLTLGSGQVIALGTMTQSAGTYTASFGPFFDPSSVHAIKGSIKVSIAITCPSDPPQTIDFLMYVDPSGRVVDSITGQRVAGATVSLLRSDTLSGTFAPLPAGSVLMSPSNRRNSDTADGRGLYGWDVAPGYYKVQASAAGYTCDATNPPPGFSCLGDTVESGTFIVPPAVIDLDLPLRFPDFTPPSLSLPAPVTLPATGPSGAVATWSASATDLVDGSVPVTCVPASGSTFPVGATTVFCSASDAHLNTAIGGFTVTVQPSGAISGEVPGGEGAPGVPFTIAPGPGDSLVLTWAPSCFATDVDYAIYEGLLGDFTDTYQMLCSTGGATTATVFPDADDVYFLVVPNTGSVEGSYGRDSRSVERRPSSFPCFPQAAVACQ
jgi:HYR domain-containing protein